MIRNIFILISTFLNFCMFDWSGKNGDKSGKSQGIWISCVSYNPDYALCPLSVLETIQDSTDYKFQQD